MTHLVAPAPDPQLVGESPSSFAEHGYHIARNLIPRDEAAALREHFMAIHARAPIYELYAPDAHATDPLLRYPRLMQPHRWDAVSRRYLLDARILDRLRLLLAEEPLAVQSMFYFKPPGSAGQGFHQDNFYLMARPGTCVAAWLAVDDADAGNGGLWVVPGSHHRPIASPADGQADRWGSLVPPPTREECREVRLAAGDCLFFGGSLIHGSEANTSSERWRRSFICHYIGQTSSTEVAAYYHPVLAAGGRLAEVEPGLDLPPGR